MNITPWTVYWITRLDNISATAGVLTFIFGIALLMVAAACVIAFIESCEKEMFPYARKCFRIIAPLFVVTLLISVLTPSTKEMAAIIVLPRVINNQDVQALGSDLPKLAREWMEELRPTPKDAEKTR